MGLGLEFWVLTVPDGLYHMIEILNMFIELGIIITLLQFLDSGRQPLLGQ
jgi:hypothetical protein